MYFASFLLIVLLGADAAVCDTDPDKIKWDILIFTQQWPITVCYEWKEKDGSNECAFPTLRDIWTIHGIWPTKNNTEGPNFCNKTWKFDPDQLEPLEQQLNIYWVNVEKNTPTFSFWKHEWLKHGTCAAMLASLNNEGKYFKKGLDWIGKYDMQTILSKSGVTPNKTQGYIAEQFHYAIKKVLGKNPAIECIRDDSLGYSLISEIRICFNKTLDLIDCDGIKDPAIHVPGDIITSCDPNRVILYPSIVPGSSDIRRSIDYKVPWPLNFYRFLQFLIWFTL